MVLSTCKYLPDILFTSCVLLTSHSSLDHTPHSLPTLFPHPWQVVSILHHHFEDHHVTGQYVPTDFFETSAMIITLILMGKYLECAAKGKTSEAITKVSAGEVGAGGGHVCFGGMVPGGEKRLLKHVHVRSCLWLHAYVAFRVCET